MAEKTRAQQLVGDIAPKLADLTDEVLFGDVWRRPELSPRDRSLAFYAGWPRAMSAVHVAKRVFAEPAD